MQPINKIQLKRRKESKVGGLILKLESHATKTLIYVKNEFFYHACILNHIDIEILYIVTFDFMLTRNSTVFNAFNIITFLVENYLTYYLEFDRVAD